MKLRGRTCNERGYAMAVLLVSLSVMAVLLTVAMPVWKHATQREKEAELIFRGQQYARAINLFQRKHGPGTLPPTIDVLLEEHDLRKKYKDPITNGDFQVILQGRGTTPGTGSPGSQTPGTSGRGAPMPISPLQGIAGQRQSSPASAVAAGGVIGVQSKSTNTSIRIYNGRTHYNEWTFVFQPPQAPGTGGMPGRTGGPGQRGNPFPTTGPGRGGPPNFPPGGRGFPTNPNAPPGGRGPGR